MNVLVLNMGMKSIRSIIFDENGSKLAAASKTLTTEINDIRVEQDPVEWWDKAVDVMKASLERARLNQVDYITVTSSASCLVCVGRDGNPLDKAIMVSDKRASEEARIIEDSLYFKSIETETGLRITSSLMLPKILWIKKNKPDVFTGTNHFLSPNDYLIFCLCGKVLTDELNAAKYHYSFKSASYPLDLLNELGINPETLPEVRKTGTAIGALREEVRQCLKISHKTEVVLTSYDAICSFVGSGVSNEGDASDVSGTVTVFRMLSKKRKLNTSSRVYITPFKQGRFNIIGGSNNLGGGLIEWVKQCYYSKEEYPYEVMEKEALESEVGARGIIFLPYLLGERTPIWNDDARGTFFGLERMHTRKDMTRAVFEAAAFIDRSMIEAIGETSANVKTIRLSGGLARLNLISQIKADVTGKEVIVMSEFETTASGAAMMVFNGQRKIEFDHLSGLFSKSRMTIYPDMANHMKYRVLYDLFMETYHTLVPMFERRRATLNMINESREIQIENL